MERPKSKKSKKQFNKIYKKKMGYNLGERPEKVEKPKRVRPKKWHYRVYYYEYFYSEQDYLPVKHYYVVERTYTEYTKPFNRIKCSPCPDSFGRWRFKIAIYGMEILEKPMKNDPNYERDIGRYKQANGVRYTVFCKKAAPRIIKMLDKYVKDYEDTPEGFEYVNRRLKKEGFDFSR